LKPNGLATRLLEERSARRAAVVPYLLVDRRRLGLSRSLVRAMRNSGAAAVELGFPFSDPIADGPILQEASARALAHQTSWHDLLTAIQLSSRELPTAVMTYANPVFHRGLLASIREMRSAGASALIVPDLSLEDAQEWRIRTRQEGVSLVLMAAPSSSEKRVRDLVRKTEGFLYIVSRFGTTGKEEGNGGVDLRPLISTAHRARPELPLLVGFGVQARGDVRAALAQGADGVIVGSALEQVLTSSPDSSSVERFLRPLVAEARSISRNRSK